MKRHIKVGAWLRGILFPRTTVVGRRAGRQSLARAVGGGKEVFPDCFDGHQGNGTFPSGPEFEETFCR